MLIVESTLLTWSALFDLFFAFEYIYKTQEVVFLVFLYPLISLNQRGRFGSLKSAQKSAQKSEFTQKSAQKSEFTQKSTQKSTQESEFTQKNTQKSTQKSVFTQKKDSKKSNHSKK